MSDTDVIYDRAAMLSLAEEIAALREKVAGLELDLRETRRALKFAPSPEMVSEQRARAEKAEKERDEALALAYVGEHYFPDLSSHPFVPPEKCGGLNTSTDYDWHGGCECFAAALAAKADRLAALLGECRLAYRFADVATDDAGGGDEHDTTCPRYSEDIHTETCLHARIDAEIGEGK